MQRCESGSPFDAFNLPNESIPQAGRNSGSACSEKSLPVHRSLLGGSERRSLEADCTPQKNFWLAFAAWRAIVWQPPQAAETVFECGVGECSAHVADAQPLASPRTGCRTGDPPCLDLDLRSRDAPAPAAPRWRKTHWGLGSVPLTVQNLCLTREKWWRQARCPCRKTGFAGRINQFAPVISLFCTYPRLRRLPRDPSLS